MTKNNLTSVSLPSTSQANHTIDSAQHCATSTLDQSPAREVLSRLYAEARENDARIAEEEKAAEAAGGGVIDERTLASIRDRKFMAVAPEVGRLIYLLVRSRRPALAVEFGASFGISAIHIAAALRDNGFGRLITTELSAAKAARTGQHLQESGLADLVEIRQGDAFESLAAVEKIDLLMLDGWKPLYLPLLRQLEPVLSPGCLIMADDTIKFQDELRPYLDYVRDVRNDYVSCGVPLDDGMEVSVRN
jgi:predicted O-methyltransferase YrrM